MLPQLLLLLLPLLRRIALGCPRMYRRNLYLQRRVHETVPRKEGLLVELGGDDYCIEGLAAAAGHVFNLDVRGVEFGLERSGDGFGCYARGVCFSVCLGICWCSHGKARAGGGERAQIQGDR